MNLTQMAKNLQATAYENAKESLKKEEDQLFDELMFLHFNLKSAFQHMKAKGEFNSFNKWMDEIENCLKDTNKEKNGKQQ